MDVAVDKAILDSVENLSYTAYLKEKADAFMAKLKRND